MNNRMTRVAVLSGFGLLLLVGGVQLMESFSAAAGEPKPADAEDAADEPNRAELLKTFRDEFVAITPGKGQFPAKFTMGRNDNLKNEAPAREVALRQPFFMAKYEVPQNLWQAVMGENPSRWKGSRNSVEMLDYAQATDFCERATKLLREAKLITDTQVVRLPSEEEWEYCCRAGTQTAYSFGDDPKQLDAYGWYTGNAAGNDPPVGAKKPNPWGLYDMHGYLWEWTSAGDEKARFARGGSWKDPANRCTSTARLSLPLTAKDDALGLRCVLAEAAEETE